MPVKNKSVWHTKAKNFRLLLFANSLAAFGTGLFLPFYYLFVRDFGGGVENFGIAMGALGMAASLTAYFSGRYSDKIGRKPMLVASMSASALVLLAYTIISELWQLYALQVLFGIISAVFAVAEKSFLGDLTSKSTRGKSVGLYLALTGILAAFAMMISGFLVKDFGIKFIFYVCSAIWLCSAFLLSLIKE